MDKNCNVRSPVNFNCWKHHAGFIKGQIDSITEIKRLDEPKEHLLQIGDSQMDLYFGKHSPQEISEQIMQILNRRKISSSEQYKSWLAAEEKDYQPVELKDKSAWILRLGEDPRRYVHIHPGRYSPHTVRVKATALKTAIMILCFVQTGEKHKIETEVVNVIRKKYLNEPPLKSFSNTSALKRLIDLFYSEK
ncbi:MAG TPA: hypothetical protein VIY47_11645 [Ignavibacteriaceae bacterium]